MTNTHNTPQTVLIYTQHPPVTHWRKLNLPFVDRLNHQYYYPKISTGFAPKNNETKPFIPFRDKITELQVYAQYSIKMR